MEDEEIFKVYADTRYNPKGALWEVSNLGSVRKNGEEILPYVGTDNYLRFGRDFKLHRAVAELFIPNPENKPTVDHKNRQKFDNRASNLRWATWSEQSNNRDLESIRMKISSSHKGKKLSEEHKANLRTAALGRTHSEETKAKIGAAGRGKVWVTNPTTEQSTLVTPSQLPEYFDKGYIKGRKIKK